MPVLPLSGVVLAGGRSSRFGSDKALHELSGRTLLEHALASLAGCAERFVVGGDERYAFAGVLVVPDEAPGEGPLAGLATALAAAREGRVALCACDMPALTPTYWEFLAVRAGAAVVIPEGPDGRPEPLAALYSRECLPLVRAALAAGERRLAGWHDRLAEAGLERVIVPWEAVLERFGGDLFRNVNRPEDVPPGRP